MYKQIVFDLGNVLFEWDPAGIIRKSFTQVNLEECLNASFFHDDWLAFDAGLIDEAELMQRYQQRLGLSDTDIQQLKQAIRQSLVPKPESVAILKHAHQQGYDVYPACRKIPTFKSVI